MTEGQLGGHFHVGCVADLFHCGSEQGKGSRAAFSGSGASALPLWQDRDGGGTCGSSGH